MLNIFLSQADRPGTSCWVLSYVIIGPTLGFCLAFNAHGEVEVRPFTVEAIVSVESFEWLNPNPVFATSSQVLFAYSNGNWNIQLTYTQYNNVRLPDVTTPIGTILNCRNIPDGIRYFHHFPSQTNNILRADALLDVAIAEASSLPPPERIDLLVTWLAFSPNPQLPIINGNQMRRLINVILLNDPKNKGTYTSRRLISDSPFLADLTISNDGTDWIPDGDVFHVTKWDPPFARGFVEFAYTVTDTISYEKNLFPREAVLTLFFPQPGAKSNQDVYPSTVARVATKRVRQGDFSMHPFPKLFAHDYRPPGLGRRMPLEYVVEKDNWVSVRDLEPLIGLRRTRPSAYETQNRHIWGIVLLITALAPVIVGLTLFLRKKRTNKMKG